MELPFSTSPFPSPRPLSVRYFSSLVGTRVFPSCFQSASLPFPWYIHSQHFPQYVFFVLIISPSHQSSLRDLLEACVTLVVPRMCSFLILSLRVTQYIHRSILISFNSIRFFLFLRCSPRFRLIALLPGSLFCRPSPFLWDIYGS